MHGKDRRLIRINWAVNIMPERRITTASNDWENELPPEIPPLLRMQMTEHSPYVEVSYGHVEAVTVHYLDLQRALAQLLEKCMVGRTPR